MHLETMILLSTEDRMGCYDSCGALQERLREPALSERCFSGSPKTLSPATYDCAIPHAPNVRA